MVAGVMSLSAVNMTSVACFANARTVTLIGTMYGGAMMPTEESNLVRVLKALLSVGDVMIQETDIASLGNMQRGYSLTVNSNVILDGQHARAVRDACGIAIDDGIPSDSPTRCGCRETYMEYLTDGCPLHGGG
jgi:hypothetical protein